MIIERQLYDSVTEKMREAWFTIDNAEELEKIQDRLMQEAGVTRIDVFESSWYYLKQHAGSEEAAIDMMKEMIKMYKEIAAKHTEKKDVV